MFQKFSNTLLKINSKFEDNQIILTKVLLILFLVSTTTGFSQQPVSVHLTEKDGLPDKEFYDILEDDNGLIWLAAKGLFSYNGSEYVSYNHPKQVGLSVFSLTKDKDNKIWYTNLANQVFYIENGEVHLFLNLKQFFKGALFLLESCKDFLIINVNSKILICNKETGEILFENKSRYGLFRTNPLKKKDSIFFINEAGNYTVIDKLFSRSL